MSQSSRKLALVLLACLAVSLFSVIYPMYVIRPFRPQGVRELAAALVVARFRPSLALISAVMAIVTLFCYWRAQPRKWWRGLAAVGAGFVAILAVLARVNVYELMFHPVDGAALAAPPQSDLHKDEKVTAVKVGGAARAYPSRIRAYHHVIND